MTADPANDRCRHCGAQLEQPDSMKAGLCAGCRRHREQDMRDERKRPDDG